jgi:DNA-binding SARP family transcriptional activator
MADARFEFRILGPLEVRACGDAVAMGGPRQRALLAVLLLSANRVVSRDRLIEELMLDQTTLADRTLIVQVSRLRKALRADDRSASRLIAQPPGYLLRVETGELDLDVFDELVAAGRAALEGGESEAAVLSFRRRGVLVAVFLSSR